MLNRLSTAGKVVGVKQTKRAVEGGKAALVFLAQDADPRVTDPIRELCADRGVSIEEGASMKELGAACGIAVGSAVAALLK